MRAMVAAVMVVALGSGCAGGATGYAPQVVGRGELTLRYDDGLEVWAGKRMLATAPRFEGLSDFVGCVPDALEHAELAESDGGDSVALGWAGGIIGVSGLAGLSGLGYLGKDDTLAAGILASGVGVGLVGVLLAAISRRAKNDANGHAVDALNYYNDAVGSRGGSCQKPESLGRAPAPPIPRLPPPTPLPAAVPPPEPPAEPPPPGLEPPAVSPPPGPPGAEPPPAPPPPGPPGAEPLPPGPSAPQPY